LINFVKDRRGDILVFVAFILPITIFILHFTLTYGLAEYAKSTVITASREAARTYAVTHDKDSAFASATYIVQRTLTDNTSCFDPDTDIVVEDDGEYAVATVSYRVPVAVPGMMRLIGMKQIMGKYLPVSSSARFIKEAVPEGGL